MISSVIDYNTKVRIQKKRLRFHLSAEEINQYTEEEFDLLAYIMIESSDYLIARKTVEGYRRSRKKHGIPA